MKNIINSNLIFLRIVCILAAATFIVIGIVNGEVNLVITKATNICLECIGIG